MNDPTDSSANDLRQRMAQIRSASHGDVETILIGLRKNLDWRYHLQRHPWAFAGAAALLGYWLMPKSRKAVLDSATVKKLAAELNLPEAKGEPQDILHKWVLPLAIRWGTSGAMQVGQLLLARMMAKSGAKEAVQEEEQETSFIPPHRPR
jgi:hypothetical protein